MLTRFLQDDILLFIRLLISILIFTFQIAAPRKNIILRAIISIVALAGIAVGTAFMKYAIMTSADFLDSAVVGALFIIAYYILAISVSAAIFACFKLNFSKLIFISIAGGTIQNMIDLSSRTITDLFTDSQFIYIRIAFDVLFTALYCFAAYKLLARYLKKEARAFDGRAKNYIYVILFIALSFINNHLMSIYDSTSNNTKYLTFAVVILLDIIYLSVQFGLFHFMKIVSDKNVLEHMLYEKEKQYEISRSNIEIINMKCHDLKKQIEALEMANESDRAESFAEIKKAVMLYDSVVKTSNDTLNVLLTEKSIYCESKGIRFSCVADASRLEFMNTIDLYSMLGNAIDNAIESSERMPPEKRAISLTIKNAGGMTSMQITNYYTGKLKLDDNGVVLTSKKNTNIHGFGVKSIQHVVKKYNGTMQIDANDGIFVLQILIPAMT